MSNGNQVERPREENHENQRTASDGRRPGYSFVARANRVFLIQVDSFQENVCGMLVSPRNRNQEL